MSDAVDVALANVERDTYVLEPDGQQLPMVTPLEIISSVLRLVEVLPGTRVLELGTGSGYSTALLASLTGSEGSVVSLDVDPELVWRATQLLSRASFGHVSVVVADGQAGYPPAAPFDRFVAWAAADMLSPAWVEQIRPGGLIVAPVQLLPLKATTAVVRVRVGFRETIVGERIIFGSFGSLTGMPRYHSISSVEDADIAVVSDNQPIAWASAEWLLCAKATGYTEQILQLLQTASPRPSLLHPGEDADALRAYLLAIYPLGLTTAFTQALGPAIGISQPGSLALLFRRGYYVEAGSQAAAALRCWIGDWRAAGRPGFEQLRPVVERTPHGFRVRAAFP